MNPLASATKLIDSVGNNADKLFMSDEEHQAMLTERQRIDNTSPFMLPQIIRPLLALWAAAMFTYAQIYCLHNDLITGKEALAANSAVMLGIIGFYFNSRRNEKVNAKKTEAALKIETMKAKAEIAKEEIRMREERRDKRRAERKEDRKERGFLGFRKRKDKENEDQDQKNVEQ